MCREATHKQNKQSIADTSASIYATCVSLSFRAPDVPAARSHVPGAWTDRVRRVRLVGSVRSGRVCRPEPVHAGHRGDAQSDLGRDAHIQRRRRLRNAGEHQTVSADRRHRNIRPGQSGSCYFFSSLYSERAVASEYLALYRIGYYSALEHLL